MNKKKISRIWVIRELCKKKYDAVRPTASQMLSVIKEHGLNKYTADGKKRDKEVMTKAMQKAVASLR
tara:strand:- start:746 stop:946 length:201 start_codon:yes stop_codon:yes gene_type:complete